MCYISKPSLYVIVITMYINFCYLKNFNIFCLLCIRHLYYKLESPYTTTISNKFLYTVNIKSVPYGQLFLLLISSLYIIVASLHLVLSFHYSTNTKCYAVLIVLYLYWAVNFYYDFSWNSMDIMKYNSNTLATMIENLMLLFHFIYIKLHNFTMNIMHQCSLFKLFII